MYGRYWVACLLLACLLEPTVSVALTKGTMVSPARVSCSACHHGSRCVAKTFQFAVVSMASKTPLTLAACRAAASSVAAYERDP